MKRENEELKTKLETVEVRIQEGIIKKVVGQNEKHVEEMAELKDGYQSEMERLRLELKQAQRELKEKNDGGS